MIIFLLQYSKEMVNLVSYIILDLIHCLEKRRRILKKKKGNDFLIKITCWKVLNAGGACWVYCYGNRAKFHHRK